MPHLFLTHHHHQMASFRKTEGKFSFLLVSYCIPTLFPTALSFRNNYLERYYIKVGEPSLLGLQACAAHLQEVRVTPSLGKSSYLSYLCKSLIHKAFLENRVGNTSYLSPKLLIYKGFSVPTLLSRCFIRRKLCIIQ